MDFLHIFCHLITSLMPSMINEARGGRKYAENPWGEIYSTVLQTEGKEKEVTSCTSSLLLLVQRQIQRNKRQHLNISKQILSVQRHLQEQDATIHLVWLRSWSGEPAESATFPETLLPTFPDFLVFFMGPGQKTLCGFCSQRGTSLYILFDGAPKVLRICCIFKRPGGTNEILPKTQRTWGISAPDKVFT